MRYSTLTRLTILIISLLLLVQYLPRYTSYALPYAYLDESRHLIIVAVSQLSNGSYVGVSSDLYIRVVCPGSGRVYVETYPLSEVDLQASTRVAAIIASTVANVSFWSCDYFASIRADSPIVGGPSASGATAVAFAAALLRLPINESVVMTGMIMPDGSIGPVGGVYYKLQAALERGAKVFLVPYGQDIDVVYKVVAQRMGPVIVYRTVPETINLTEYGARHGILVKSIANVFEALNIFTDGKFSLSGSYNERVMQRIYSALMPWFNESIEFMKTHISQLLNSSKELENRLPRYARTATLVSVLNSIDQSIDSLIKQSETLEKESQYYSATSTYFNALIYAYWRYHLLNAVLNSSYINAEASKITTEIQNLLQELANISRDHVDLPRLSILINAVDRAYEGLIYANRSTSTSYLDVATQYLAIASARLNTAKLWLNITKLKLPTTAGNISANSIHELAESVYALAYNIYSYILAFSSSIQMPQNYMTEAQIRLALASETRDDVAKIALSISTISYMHQMLLSMFTQEPEAAIIALNRTIDCWLHILKEFIPIDAPLLLEFVQASQDTVSKLMNSAKLSILLAMYATLIIWTYQSSSPLNTAIEATYQCLPRTLTITVTRTVTITTASVTQMATAPTTPMNVEKSLVQLIAIAMVIAVLVVLLKVLQRL
jgi:uncharacterized protein